MTDMKNTKPKALANLVKIRLSKRSDLVEYSSLVQQSCQDAYSDKKLGFDRSLFSKKIFCAKPVQDWLVSNLYPAPKKRTWVAFLKSEMAGAITVVNKGSKTEFKGFYVAPRLQGMGLGKLLFKIALESSKGKDIVLLMYPHNLKSLNIYKKWGFKTYGRKGQHHWSVWPKGVSMKYIHMRLIKEDAAILRQKWDAV